MNALVIFCLLMSTARTLDTSSLNATESVHTLATGPVLPIFRNPVRVPGFLKNILGSPTFEDQSYWFWHSNVSRIENEVKSIPPSGYICGTNPSNLYWLCSGRHCELQQNLDVRDLIFDFNDISVAVSATITAATSLWPLDYASVNITVAFWANSGVHQVLAFESGIQPGSYSTKITPSSVRFTKSKHLGRTNYDYAVFTVVVDTKSNSGVAVSDLGLRLFFDYAPDKANNDEFVLLCGKPDVGSLSLTSIQTDVSDEGEKQEVFLLEGLQPQRFYYSGNTKRQRSSSYTFSAIMPNAIEVYHTVFKNPEAGIPVDQHLNCSIDLNAGASCQSQVIVRDGTNTKFTYTINSWQTKRIPWEDIIISTDITPVGPSDNSVLTAVMIGFCVLLVFALASFVGMFIWQRVAKVADEVEEDLMGSKYFRDDLSSTI